MHLRNAFVIAAGMVVSLLAGCGRAPAPTQIVQHCVGLTDGPESDPCSRLHFAAKARTDSDRALEHHDTAPRFKDDHL